MARDHGKVLSPGFSRRNRAQKPLGVGVERMVHQLIGPRDLADPSRIPHHDPVADLGDHGEVVGDEEHRHAVLNRDVLQEPQDPRLHRDIERCCRLIRDHEVRPADRRHGDHHPLPLSAGELMGIAG